jgi:hypothetical protein
MFSRMSRFTTATVFVVLSLAGDAFAQRGGFHGGGGGGGFHPGGGMMMGGGVHPGGGMMMGGGVHSGGGMMLGGGFHTPGGVGFGGGIPAFALPHPMPMPTYHPLAPAPAFHPVMRPNYDTGSRPTFPSGGMVNRPITSNHPAVGNRPNATHQPALSNRPALGNRPGVGGNPNFGGSRPIIPGTNRGIITNTGGNRGNNGNGYGGWGGNNPYMGYHRGWVNGHWHGHHGNWNWWSFASGLYIGELLAWGLGPSVYTWGYSPYYNPYFDGSAVGNQAVVDPSLAFDYAAPIDSSAPPPDTQVAEVAVDSFDAGREAFKEGDSARALKLSDKALAKLPNDPTLHQFRALIFFAQGKYELAAATLYSVLAVGPGWDWTTMIDLYPDVEVYTEQIRALEAYRKAHPDSAAARFVLAYHYITQGHMDNAVTELKHVVKLQPKDTVSVGLLKQLESSEAAADAPPQAATPPAHPTAPPADADANVGKLAGTWKASPIKDTTIMLAILENGRFTWTVTIRGKTNKLEGASTDHNGVLTLVASNTEPFVGEVTWQPDGSFKFKLVGGPPDDPGLTFRKA